MIEPEDLAKIPTMHRHKIALWLAERAAEHTGSIFGAAYQSAVRETLWGAAADLIDPLSEDSTLDHAHDVLRHAGAMLDADADTARSPR